MVSPHLKNTDTSDGSKDTLTYFLLLRNTDISIIMDSWAVSKFHFLHADADTLEANNKYFASESEGHKVHRARPINVFVVSFSSL